MINTANGPVRVFDVGAFDRISLRYDGAENIILIRPGSRPCLTVEGAPDMLRRISAEVVGGQLNIRQGGGWAARLGGLLTGALSTSLTRSRIRYTVTVSHLRGVDLFGLVRAGLHDIETDRLDVKFGGLGSLQIDGLQAGLLDLSLTAPGPCTVAVTGQASEQRVRLSGMSAYDAHALATRRTSVTLQGPGAHAIVRAEQELDVAISGPGCVEYCGHPRLTKRISALAVVAPAGALPTATPAGATSA